MCSPATTLLLPLYTKGLEGASVFKNSLDARFHPRSGNKHASFEAFGTPFVVAIGPEADFFNRLRCFSANPAIVSLHT